jgi:hypothetical protein
MCAFVRASALFKCICFLFCIFRLKALCAHQCVNLNLVRALEKSTAFGFNARFQSESLHRSAKSIAKQNKVDGAIDLLLTLSFLLWL